MTSPSADPLQPYPSSQQLPTPPKPRRWLPWVIVLGILLVITLLVVALVSVVTGLRENRTSQGAPLVAGDTGIPTAELLDCIDPCFTASDIEATVLSETTLDTFGLTQHGFPWGTYDATTADELYRSMTASWAANDGEPDTCVFALGNSPSVIDLVSDDGVLDHIEFTGEHADADITTTLDQSIRIFPDAASAASHMSTLYDQIEGCPEISIGSERERYTAQITGAPGLTLPGTVAGVGWVRTGDPGPRWRAYVFDLQLGNLVVRTRMLTDGSTSEQAFRAFVEDYAYRLSLIEPSPAG